MRTTPLTPALAPDAQDAPSGFKRTEAGVIPADWTADTVGNLFTFKNGLNKAKRFFGFGTPIVNYMDVYRHSGLRSPQLLGRVSLTAKELESFNVQRGDVFFTRTSETPDEIGMSAVMLDEPARAVFSGFLLRARAIDKRLDDRYKQYCFTTTSVRLQIVSTATYTTRALTNGRSLSAVQILLPPLHEQRAIAQALSDMDALIESLDALIAKKQAIKQTAMQQLLTGKTRLPGFSAAWEMKRLGETGSTYGGLTGKSKTDFSTGDARYVTFLNVLENVVVDANGAESVWISPGESQNVIREGDVLFNGTSESPGDLAMGAAVEADGEGLLLNSFCFGFRFRSEHEFSPHFLAYYFRGPPGRQMMPSLAQGATRYNMSKRQFLALALRVPPFEEQAAIASALRDMDAEIDALERRRDKTRSIKLGMMQQLLTGRTRLVESHEPVEASA